MEEPTEEARAARAEIEARARARQMELWQQQQEEQYAPPVVQTGTGSYVAHAMGSSLDRNRNQSPDTQQLLQQAAAHADVEEVRRLLDQGADIHSSYPLHRAAEACPEGTNMFSPPIHPTEEFDVGRIPIMQLLVERGADVNKREEHHSNAPRFPIQSATMVGAVQRVKWLLDHGADPTVEAGFMSAVVLAQRIGSTEMREVVDQGVTAKKWV